MYRSLHTKKGPVTYMPMSTLLQVQNAFKSYGPRHLFSDAAFAVNMGEHIGVIGPNGAGKTSLFKILAGVDEFDSGDVIKSRELRIGYLEQESDWNVSSTGEELLENCKKPIWELKKLGKGLGLTEEHFQKPLSSLSGGYRMRFKLLWLLGEEPNLMMLDEPTNFLDLESLLVLENFLRDFKGSFLLISHDREFLKRTTDHTLEVEDGKISKFPGDIEDYFEYKSQLLETLQARAENLQDKRKKMEDFVERFRAKASKAKQAQSRLKQLEKLEEIEIKPMKPRARMNLPEPQATGKETLALAHADLGYKTDSSQNLILKDLNFRLQRGNHVGVVGVNGAGKSTLLKTLAGRLPLLKGELEIGHNVRVGYFSQHVYEELDLNDSIIDSLQSVASKDATKQEILNMAGSFLFAGDDVYKKIRILSGGEKSRVALARMLLQKFPVLLMDEPTNHLDFETVEAMTAALKNFSGTLIVVSHDRHFIRQVSSKILEIRNGRAEYYPGTYDDYLWSLAKGAWSYKDDGSAPEPSTKQKTNTISEETPKVLDKHIRRQKENDLKKLKKQFDQLDLSVKKSQEELTQVNQKLIECKSSEAPALVKILSDLSLKIEDEEMKMLEILENIEQLES